MLRTDFPRSDAYRKAVGAAKYTEDYYPVNVLHGVIVRAAAASARIDEVCISDALEVPGVECILTATDVPDARWGEDRPDEPLLARDRLRYVGEPVALVAAESKEAALTAGALVGVHRVDQAPVTTIEAALRPGAPLVNEGHPNAWVVGRIDRGDIAAARDDAVEIIETTYRSHRIHQGYIEPRAALAELDQEGCLVVTTTSQAPFVVKQGIAELLQLAVSRVAVRVPSLGGGFGGKLHLGVAAHAAALCLHTGRPVQVVCSRAEELQAGAPRENSVIRVRSMIDGAGTIIGREAEVYLDAGAYARDTPHVGSLAALLSTGPLAIPSVAVSVYAVYTNTTPTGSMRGPTGPQMVFATEMHTEEVGRRLGQGPVAIRRRHLVQDGDQGATGQPLEDPAAEEILDVVTLQVDEWKRDPYPTADEACVRGYGVACAWWCTSPGASSAVVTLGEDGRATVLSGATEIGTGAVTSGVRAIVANALGLALDDVILVSGRTDLGVFDVGSAGSRTLYGAGNAALRASDEVKRILRDYVADHFEADPGDIVFADGQVGVAGAPLHSMPIRDAVVAIQGSVGPVIGGGRFQAVAPAPTCSAEAMYFETFNEPTYHCHGAEIDIDTTTGHITVLRYVAAHDVGTVLNPMGARGQVEGGVVQGLGYALYEEVITDAAGVVQNDSLVDYRLPTVRDAPREIHVHLIDGHRGKTGPLGAKGIGEAPVILPAAAIGSALRDALGAAPDELPLSPPRVLDFIRATGS